MNKEYLNNEKVNCDIEKFNLKILAGLTTLYFDENQVLKHSCKT